MKVVITGALGYIGTELCKIYSGESRYKKIIAVDNRFLSERVSQLRDWGIDFVQCSIMDIQLMGDILKDADIVYHLAGVTDVAYVKSESNEEKDRQITEYGIFGTRNVINLSPDNCKIVFPSTHVVYEGLSDTKFDIEESFPTSAVLTYSKGKVQSEIDLKNSNKNFIVVRLGSVYGLSSDTMRINIMPNLFSKIASQNGTISLFSGGIQHKSLVNILDVVRAMKFLGESKISKEVFHLSNENMTIKEVASLCKKINPNVNIVETNDEVPNLGYTISNKKLLSTGFKFLYNIETSISEMINNWSLKTEPIDLEYLVRGKNEYIDDRGKISNYELTESINLIGYIESNYGSVRANHYHPIQEQKCLLISGKFISVTKDLSDDKSPVETRIVNAGDLSVIRPNVAHTMVFLEDSIFLNLVRGERDHENYGITHTIPYKLVDENFRKNLLSNYKTKCRSCGDIYLKDVISLGMSPLANNLLNGLDDKTDMYPLEVKYCDKCKNAQLSFVVPPKKMFDNYLYVSSTAKSFRDHFETAATQYINEFKLNSNSVVIDIGSNDGVFLKPLKERWVNVIGIEPAKNISEMANKNGIFTINTYFNKKSCDAISKAIGKIKPKADLITASNVFAHSDEIIDITTQSFNLLSNDGVFIVEVQYLLDTMKDLTFDNIYHEHVNYWSVTSLNNFFDKLGYTLYKVEHINTHGGSIRAYVSRNRKVEDSVNKFMISELEFGINSYDTYVKFRKDVDNIKCNVVSNIKHLKSKYNRIAAYGSPAKATTSLNYFRIGSDVIDYTIEDNELKNNKLIPGVNIPIKNKSYCLQNKPDLIIVLAWNFFEEIKKNNKDLIDMGIKFISIKDLYQPNIN